MANRVRNRPLCATTRQRGAELGAFRKCRPGSYAEARTVGLLATFFADAFFADAFLAMAFLPVDAAAAAATFPEAFSAMALFATVSLGVVVLFLFPGASRGVAFGGCRDTVRVNPSAAVIRLMTGKVGTVPPASKRATADCVIFAALASWP
jgi:hypothetical protein